MFIVYLKFGPNKARASDFMKEHVEWIQHGVDDEVFLCAGSLPNGQGGVVLAYGLTQEQLEGRLERDPFVQQGVVTVEVLPISVGKTQAQFAFLAGE